MASRPPRVSIGMAVYNDEKFLRPALDSLLAQDYADFELIISDNASTDATEAIGREYAARDSRIRYHRNATNIGACENFNKVFRLSSGGEYFMWAGGHDVWAPTYLSRCVEALESDRTLVQCNSVAQYMSQDGKEFTGVMRQIDTRRYGVFVRASLILWQASTFLIYSVYRASALRRPRPLWQGTTAPDLFLGFEISLLGPTAIIPEPLYFMRDNRGEQARPITRAQGSAMFRERMYGRSTVSGEGFWRRNLEWWHVLKGAPLSYGMRIAVMGSAISTCVLKLYPYVPSVFRRAMRGLVGRCFHAPHN